MPKPPSSDLSEKQLESRSAYQGKLLHVKQDRVRLPDGKTTVREYIVHPGAAVVIALLENGELILERQFRYPLRREFYELPAGKLEPDEDPLVCAQRELLEETGYSARTWRYVTTLHPCIGYSSERLVYYLARDLTLQGKQLDEGEFLEILTLDLPTALQWVREERITDNKTVSGLFWAEKLLRSGW